MIVSCVKWILFSLLFLGTVSVAALDTNCDPEPNLSPDTLRLNVQEERLPLSVIPDHSLISICGLQIGEKYSVLLVPMVPHAKGHLKWQTPGVATRPKTENIQEFTATEDCAIIELLNTSGFSVASTISVGCVSCPPPAQSSQSNMGIMTNSTYTASSLIQDVFISGDCFTVDPGSINFDGFSSALGYFSSGLSSVNIEDGIILSTGRISTIEGGNDLNSNTTELQGSFFPGSEPDLERLLNFTQNVYDVEVLEFDFVPTAEEVSFDYVFASEEYCEYVDSEFNDVFGFFISGPGINGPFSNNAENIAQIPGGTDYIAINSVNHLTNPAYYVNNIPAAHFSQFPFVAASCQGYPIMDGPAINDIEFDGFTTVLTARATVIPCETYHIKLAIADAADRRFDSAVFLKANSFSSSGSALANIELPDAFGGVAIEGCIGGNFVFQRQDSDINEPLTVHYTVSANSTALSGIDYVPLPDSIIIPAGQEFYYLPVEVYEDFLLEGNETIILELVAPCSCSSPFIEMTIADPEPLAVSLDDQILCEPVLVEVEALATGGLATYSFLWSNGDSTATLSTIPLTDTTYWLTVTDFCGREVVDSVSFNILGIPEATISGDFDICPEGDPAFLTVLFSQPGPYTLIYSINGIVQTPINNITDNPFTLETTVPGNYELVAIENGACDGLTFGTASVSPLDFEVVTSVNDVTCPGENDGSILIQVNGGLSPYSYQWNPVAADAPILENLAPGQYLLTITEAGGCTLTQEFQIGLSAAVPFAEAGTSTPLTCSNTETELIGSGSTGGTYTYMWSTPDGHILSGETTLNPIVDEAGTYTLWVTNILTNCRESDEVIVTADTVAPIPEIISLGPVIISCNPGNTILDGSSSQPMGSLIYDWSTLDGVVDPGQTNLPQIDVKKAGLYQLLVTNSINGCTAMETLLIEADTTQPVGEIAMPGLLTCRDSIIRIDASGSSSGMDFGYRWSTPDGNILNGSTSLFLEVDEPGLYQLEITNITNGCQTVEAVEVAENRLLPIVEAGVAEELDCDSPVVVLDGSASSQGNSFYYLWSTPDGHFIGDSLTLFPEVDRQGTYYLLVTDDENGCTATDWVYVLEDVNRPFDLEILPIAPRCFGDFGAFEIKAVLGGEGPFLYSMDAGENYSTEIFFENQASGDYTLWVQDINGCEFDKDFTIPQVAQRIVLLDPLVEIELGETANLDAITNMPTDLIDTIIWSPTEGLSCSNCLDPEATAFFNTGYAITVVDTNGCVAQDEMELRVRKDRKVYIPTGFSPNGDGANDLFFIHSDANSVQSILRFQIFNRWGEQVFEISGGAPNDPDFGWDGRFKGKELNPAVFTYFAELEFVDGYKQLYKGDVSLVK